MVVADTEMLPDLLKLSLNENLRAQRNEPPLKLLTLKSSPRLYDDCCMVECVLTFEGGCF